MKQGINLHSIQTAHVAQYLFCSLLNPQLPWLEVSRYLMNIGWMNESVQFSSVQSLSRVQLFATPWTTACQPSLSITNSRSLLKLMSIESVMPSNHLILCHPLLLLPSMCPSIRVLSNESVLHIRWPKYWSFTFSISPSSEYSGLISYRIDWLDLLAVQGTLKSLFQHHNSRASVFQCSAFFMVQTFLYSHKQCAVFQFLCILTSICYFYVLDSEHTNGCEILTCISVMISDIDD